jgi:uncharacterized lipoprotein YddW (UPF0748 family)
MRTAWVALTVLLVALPPSGLAAAAAHERIRPGAPHLALWMEPSANLLTLSTVEGVRETLDQARAAGVDTVIPEAKNAWGYVTYQSSFAPTIDTSPMPQSDPAYAPPADWYPHDYDMLKTIIDEAHARGMRVDVAVNTMGEGYSPLQAGPAFEHPDWQALSYLATRPVLAPDGESFLLSGVDILRGQDALVLYTPASGDVTSTSRWGVEVAVSGGMVTDVRDRTVGDEDPGPTPIPAGGYVLSGHGAAADWLRHNLEWGDTVQIGPVVTRMVPSSAHSIFAFASPADSEVWSYVSGVIYEILTHYDVDGIVLDRTRYQDITEDFSDASRAQFEASIGHRVAHWPDDIYTYVPLGYWVDWRPGPLYREWLGYRAHTIYEFTRAVAALVHTLRPRVALGMYVGAWYPVYFNEGVNWASPSVRPPYAWITDEWVRSGLAPLLDYLMIGLYYRPVTISEAYERHADASVSVQGGAQLALSLVHGDTPLVGSLLVPLYEDSPRRFAQAIRITRRLLGGTMVFDLIYVTEDHLWRAMTLP